MQDPRPDPLAQLTARELLDVVEEEVQRLPEVQRSVMVLCCLQGHTREEAARMLGSSPAAVKSHLQRGRRRLQGRLLRRRIDLASALAVVAVSQSEAMPALLLPGTVQKALYGGPSSSATALAHSVLKGMALSKLASVMTMVLILVVAASAAIVLVNRWPASASVDDQSPATLASAKDGGAASSPVRTDEHGDPLPAGALARLGTVRFRHTAPIHLTAFTPDGKRLVVRGDDGVRVWDTATGKELRHFAADAERVFFSIDTAVSPDGKRVAVAAYGTDSVIQLWDMDSGNKAGSLGTRMRPLVRFSPDGKLLATSATPTDVELWQVAGQKKLRSWKVSPMEVSFISFSADARRLLTASVQTDEIRLWDAATGRLLQEFRPPGPLNRGYYRYMPPMALSPDGNLLAIVEWTDRIETALGKVEWKTAIQVRDAATGKTVRRLTCPTSEDGLGGIPGFHALMFTADGDRLITGGPDRFVRIWDVKTEKALRRLALESGPAKSLTLSPDGKKVAVVIAGGDNSIQVLDLTSGAATATDGHFSPIAQAALSPDGRTAVTSGPDGRRHGRFGPLNYVHVWDTATGRIRHRLDGRGTPFLWLQLSEEGRTLFSISSDRTLRVWDVASGQERRRIQVPCEPRNYVAPDRVALTPDGKTLALLDKDHTIHVLDAANGVQRQHLRGAEDLLGMKLTPDGRFLTLWSYDRKVRIWDTLSGRPVHEYSLPQAGNQGYVAAVSPDARMLAALGVWSLLPQDPPRLICLDLATGQIIRRIRAPLHSGVLAFSPDGRTLAWTSATDTVIRLLEVASGRERRLLAGHRGQVTALAFSADGRRLLSGCADSTALVWDLTSACSSRAITAGEVEALWNDLAGADAARAYGAIQRLAATPSWAISMFDRRLHPAAAVDERRLRRLIADLDSDSFTTRERASKDLATFGEQAEPAYRKALADSPPPEVRRRLEDLLKKAGAAWWDVSGERLRSLRAIEALELAGTREACAVLEKLAAGAEGARLTHEAKAARQRVASR
jgi:WD40 repeat protein